MVHADGDIPCRLQRATRGVRLVEADVRAGQRGLVDQPLTLLEPRHMRVAEQRDTVGTERGDSGDRLLHVGDALAWKAVHEVHVDGGHARLAKHRHGVLDKRKRLHPPHRRLHIRVDVLHAQRRAVDAGRGVGAGEFTRESARVDLHGMGSDMTEIEARPQTTQQGGEAVRREDVRRAAAPVDLHNASRRRCVGRQIDLPPERFRISVEQFVATHRGGVAAAVPAQVATVRDVDVDGQRRFRRQGVEPARKAGAVHLRGEVRRRGVARVAGRGPAAVGDERGTHPRTRAEAASLRLEAAQLRARRRGEAGPRSPRRDLSREWAPRRSRRCRHSPGDGGDRRGSRRLRRDRVTATG